MSAAGPLMKSMTIGARAAQRRPPLHVAFFNRAFYPDTSATGQLLTELCEGLARDHGCKITVVSGVPLLTASGTADAAKSGKAGLTFTREDYRGIRILRARGTRFSKKRFVGRFSNYVTYFLSACYAGLRMERPDLVVALTDPPIIGLAGLLAARRHKVPFVMAYKDVFPEVARLLEDFQSPTVERILQAVNCFLARRADRVAALGGTMARRLIEGKGAPAERTVVIPDWVDCSAIRPAPKDNPFSRENGLDRRFVVMHSGNIGLSQGLERVVDAAALLQSHPEITVVFVGEGVKKSALQDRARKLGLNNVQFLPFAPKSRLIESFASADVFVVSLKEGLAGFIVPSKLYGILAAGRPYVAAVEPDSEVSEITRRHGCGLLAPSGKPEEIAARILHLYRNPADRQRMGARARAASVEFDRPRQVKAYRVLFEEVHREASRVIPTPWSKRIFDITFSGLGLLLSLPLALPAALAVKLEDGGPVFHAQRRVGRGGKLFKSRKFRSMVVHRDDSAGPRQAADGDERITRVGRLLRATALDELPQLWNILRGDMSFVGPRALLPKEVEVNGAGESISIKKVKGYSERHRVVPGLTGIAQIYADRDIPRQHKFRLDCLYIRKRSFWLDLRLFLLSFWITARGKWEHRGRKV